jgi:hypothetical protein
MLLNLIPLHHMPTEKKQPMACPECGGLMRVIAVRVKEADPLLL